MAHLTAAFDQDSFRGRNDDGSETTATWKAASNINWTQAVDENFRVRFLIQETAGGSTNNKAFKLQRNLNAGGWVDVTATSAVVKIVDSTNLTDHADTTQQLGAGAFVTPNGGVDDVDGTTGGTASFAGNDETETEHSCQIVGADVADLDTVELRVVMSNGTVLDTYTNTPSITVSKPAPAGLHLGSLALMGVGR